MIKKYLIVMSALLAISTVSESKAPSSALKKTIIAAAIIVPVTLVGFSVYKSMATKERSRSEINGAQIPDRPLSKNDNDNDERGLASFSPETNKDDGSLLKKERDRKIKERIAEKDDSNPKINFGEFKDELNQKVQNFVTSEMPKNASKNMQVRFEKSTMRLADDKLYRSLEKIYQSNVSERDDLMNSYLAEIKNSALGFRNLINEGEKLKREAEKYKEAYLAIDSDKSKHSMTDQEKAEARRLYLETGRRSNKFDMQLAMTTISDEAGQKRAKDVIDLFKAKPAKTTTLYP
jgi:hypothetical protein